MREVREVESVHGGEAGREWLGQCRGSSGDVVLEKARAAGDALVCGAERAPRCGLVVCAAS